MNDSTPSSSSSSSSSSFTMDEPIPSYTEVMAALSTSTSSSTPSSLDNVNNTPIPTYEEATSTFQNSTPQSSPSPDLPPAYSLLDTTQTTFTLNGTFIYTSTGIPAYQLSHALNSPANTFTPGPPCLRVRRLRRKEFQQHQRGHPVPFDTDSTLYEIHNQPLQESHFHLIGQRRACFKGVMMMKQHHTYPWGPPSRGKWRINHVLRPGSRGIQLFSSKPVRPTSSLANKKSLAPSPPVVSHVWNRDTTNEVAATESFRIEADGSVTPVLELVEGLDQKWREALICAWVARLWGICGEGKTKSVARGAAWGAMLGGL